MGKNLIQQRRGKGSSSFRAPSHRYFGEISHKSTGNKEFKGRVIDLVKCPGHSAPVARVVYDDNEESIMAAPEGLREGQYVFCGETALVEIGNTLPLKNIPEGTSVYNIEGNPGDGGKFVRSSGVCARVLAQLGKGVVIELPSKKKKIFNRECRANIGVISGGGRKEKPFLKAGKKYHAMRAKNKLYPSVSGTSMNSVDHPFGGSSSHTKGRPTQASRNAPPGRKVGKIAPKRTGMLR